MVTADLHVHTTNSDGSMSLDDVPEAARRAGVSAVAVTDHDRLHPALGSPVDYLDGIQIVHGIELRVDAGDQRVDLLGYGAEPTTTLVAEIERLQADRVERGRAIVENVEERLGVSLDVAVHEGIGRPHVARATAARTDMTVDEVFDELIGNDGPCYVARDVPDFETGRDLLDEACRLVGLAHPHRYPDTPGALELCADLDAVERYYPYGEAIDPAPVEAAMRHYDLLPTGGSDAHDATLGRSGLDAGDYVRFLDAGVLPHP